MISVLSLKSSSATSTATTNRPLHASSTPPPYYSPMGDTRGLLDDDSTTATDLHGQVAHRSLIEHSARLARTLHQVTEGVWCLVGNGLSNQTFITAPDGIIAIDTGESIEEMRDALIELRTVSDAPVVAVIYTHFHYVSGTQAILDSEPVTAIWGHERIEGNLRRSATEIAPAYGRGLVEQFAMQLPTEGPDGNVNVGLGRAYRMPEHAPYSGGHIPATHTFAEATTIDVAGLTIEVTPAPSDADDSVTLWMPSLGVAVHNIMWPALFNVFAIRGEEYRDPRVLLTGLDHLHSLGADHLVATHGPPLSGADEIESRLLAYRDSVQFLWDQTVRWTNRGATSAELAHRVQLPSLFGDDWLTQQHYGIAEHHARQIRNGLFGFFDGDPANILPLDTNDHAAHLIEAMGGPEAVRERCKTAITNDLRWGLYLAAQLAHHDDATDEDRGLLANALRTAARRTPSANVRNWCITKALDVEGSIDMSRHRTHRLGRRQVANWDLATSAGVLRVMIEPEKLTGINCHVALQVDDERCGLHFRNHILCPTDGVTASHSLSCNRATWDALLTGSTTLTEAINSGDVTIDGESTAVLAAFGALDHPAFGS